MTQFILYIQSIDFAIKDLKNNELGFNFIDTNSILNPLIINFFSLLFKIKRCRIIKVTTSAAVFLSTLFCLVNCTTQHIQQNIIMDCTHLLYHLVYKMFIGTSITRAMICWCFVNYYEVAKTSLSCRELWVHKPRARAKKHSTQPETKKSNIYIHLISFST